MNQMICSVCSKTPEQVGTLYCVHRHDSNLYSIRCKEHIEEGIPPRKGYSVPYIIILGDAVAESLKNVDPRAIKILDAVIETIKSEEGWRWYPGFDARVAILKVIEKQIDKETDGD